ncbi:MAG: M4 family metallopeptidase [Legionella sp.]|uniref:M4 family metallopeptidase n=1 Tax=Legionella sp. TaxID=459 RepID=UPI0039E4285B
MLRKLVIFPLFFLSHQAFSTEVLNLYQAPLSSLNSFVLTQKHKNKARSMVSGVVNTSTLQEVNQTQKDSKTITRYQQLYRGLTVVGAQVTLTNEANHAAQVNGHLLTDIHLNTKPAITQQQALNTAKISWQGFNPQTPMHEEKVELQIRVEVNNEPQLTYLVSFKSTEADGKPAWPFFIIDAHTGVIHKQWNNVKQFADGGPGGNEKVHEYWYGKDGLPALEVTQKGTTCVMETPAVKLVNLGFAWDWENLLINSFEYPCNNNQGDFINGAFSPINDAYFFGHVIVDMYRNWYGVNALQTPDGAPSQLIMRVHFGQGYDNAFWEGGAMSFGDGSAFYPLVSLDIAGHEVTHGFTEQHANLEYHDQSGALNESLSDMAGQVARAYLLEKSPELYNKMYLEPNTVTWGIGETIVRDSFGKALRFMDYPSADGNSADCFDKTLAQSHGAYCAISYEDVLRFAEQLPGPQYQQNFIVHTASGIFNKAFYLLAKEISIKKTYHLMIMANSKYWTPTTDFEQGACGVLYSARDLAVDVNKVKKVFARVGIDTQNCSIA